MTDNVIPFKPADPLIWICNCGCQSYRILSNDTFECCNCHDIKASGEWVKHLPPVPSDPTRDDAGTLSVTALGVPELAMRRVMKQIEDWIKSDQLAILASYSKEDGGKHWFNITDAEQKAWALRRVDELRAQLEELAV